MWSYYGAKTNIVNYYPKPKHSKIIEPFAGTARYALKHFDNDVLLVDKYEVIIKIWKWLQVCSPNDILKLPRKIDPGTTLNEMNFDCEEAKFLMGFLIKKGVERPAVKPTDWAIVHRPNHINFSLKRIAANLFKIKHWKFLCDSYENIPNEEATWFIDPPYQFGGHSYVCSNKKIDFDLLGIWCRNREGQVIVCETMKATWMDFKSMATQKSSAGWQKEAIWTNQPTAYDNEQLKLIA